MVRLGFPAYWLADAPDARWKGRAFVADRDGEDHALEALLRGLAARGYAFTTPTPATHARVNAWPENAVAADLAGVFGWSRPFRPDLLDPELMQLAQQAGILRPEGELMRSAVRVSVLDGALFVHSAYPTQATDSVFFGPDTYRFVRAVAAWLNPARAARVGRAVDIGAGAGPGGIWVARAAPQAEVLLVDINEAALRLSRINAAAAGAGNVTAVRSDLLDGVSGEFDLIVSNPPYLNDPLARAYRHGGGEFGAELSVRILDAALRRLAPGGTLILYTGVAIVAGRDPFRTEAERMCRERVGWSYEEIDPDVFGEELETSAYARADRIAAVVLVATREG